MAERRPRILKPNTSSSSAVAGKRKAEGALARAAKKNRVAQAQATAKTQPTASKPRAVSTIASTKKTGQQTKAQASKKSKKKGQQTKAQASKKVLTPQQPNDTKVKVHVRSDSFAAVTQFG